MPAGPVQIKACRSLGPLKRCTDPLEVVVQDGDALDVDIALPGPLFGPDFQSRQSDEGLVVTTVPLGSDAEAAGLEIRDRILSVDGESTRGESARPFNEHILGFGDGQRVTYEVERAEGGFERVVVPCRRLHW